MRLPVWLSFVLMLGFVSCAAGEMSPSGSYRGQILDVDTGKPLGGVLVVVIWEREVYLPQTKATTNELHAVETRTDADGRFEVSAAPETKREPFVADVRPKGIVFFAPGYVQERIEVQPGVKRFRDPTRIYMKRAQNPTDALDLGLAASFPYGRSPLLLKALRSCQVVCK